MRSREVGYRGDPFVSVRTGGFITASLVTTFLETLPDNLRLIPISEDKAPPGIDPVRDSRAWNVCGQVLESYGQYGYFPPWIGYLAWDGHSALGSCGYKGPPQGGRVEIAYFTFPEFEGRGVARWMAGELLRIARMQDCAMLVTARTLHEEGASSHVLARLGFQRGGTVQDDEDGVMREWIYRVTISVPRPDIIPQLNPRRF